MEQEDWELKHTEKAEETLAWSRDRKVWGI